MIFAFQPPVSDAAVDWALAYAAAGIAVFPCRADKKPLTEHGCLDATTDPDQIRAWWERWRYAEIGWAVPACVVVVDLDRKPGADGLRDFFEHEGVEAEAVETPIAVTPSGGRHLVFDAKGAPYRNGVRVNGSAIDVRTSGGYVVLPRSGNGRWWLKPLSTPLAPAPAWLPTKPTERPPGEAKPFTGEAPAAALEALQWACRAIETATNGAQETTLNNHCFHIGRRVGAGQLEAGPAIDALSAAAARMPVHRGPWRDLGAKVAHAVEDGMNEPWRVEEPRPFSFNSVLGIAGAVANALPEKRDNLTKWGARRMAALVAAGNIRRDLAHQVLFEAAMRTGLSGEDACAIIEKAFKGLNP
jgi:Bifunctional DNA primase/polymerase, N-terminal